MMAPVSAMTRSPSVMTGDQRRLIGCHGQIQRGAGRVQVRIDDVDLDLDLAGIQPRLHPEDVVFEAALAVHVPLHVQKLGQGVVVVDPSLQSIRALTHRFAIIMAGDDHLRIGLKLTDVGIRTGKEGASDKDKHRPIEPPPRGD